MDGASDAPPVPRGFEIFEFDQFAHGGKMGLGRPIIDPFLAARNGGFSS
jgi:hypothetical protein